MIPSGITHQSVQITHRYSPKSKLHDPPPPLRIPHSTSVTGSIPVVSWRLHLCTQPPLRGHHHREKTAVACLPRFRSTQSPSKEHANRLSDPRPTRRALSEPRAASGPEGSVNDAMVHASASLSGSWGISHCPMNRDGCHWAVKDLESASVFLELANAPELRLSH